MKKIQEKLLKFKYHFLFTLIFSLLIFSLIIWAPSLLTIFYYFWPLLLSTALFLVGVVFFSRAPGTPASEGSGERAAEGILDYVAGQPEVHVGSFKHE